MQGDTSQRHESLVPVLDRARYLAGFRTLATVVLVVHAFTEWSTWQVDPLQVVGIAAAYAALTWLLAIIQAALGILALQPAAFFRRHPA